MSGPFVLFVSVYPDMASAGKVLKQVRQEDKEENIDVLDAAVLIKDGHNKISVRDVQDLGAGRGAVFGALVGGVVGLLGGPLGAVLGAAAGAATGGITAHKLDMGFSDKALQELQRSMHSGSSALVVIANADQAAHIAKLLEPYGGKIFQQRMLSDVIKKLKQELDDEPESLRPKRLTD